MVAQFLIESLAVSMLATGLGAGIFRALLPAWWAIYQWLADFAYRIAIPWWIFVAAGAAAVLIAFLAVSFQSMKAALANPVNSLRSE